jgi:BON domain
MKMRSEHDRRMGMGSRQHPSQDGGDERSPGQYEKDPWRPDSRSDSPRRAQDFPGRESGGAAYEHRDERRMENEDAEPYEPSEGYAPFEPGHPRDEGQRFGAGPPPRYLGTGFMGRGGPGFTGGYYGFGTGSPEPDWRAGRRDAVGEGRSESDRPPARRYPQGPKGYQRSDERLREDISERLMDASYIDSSDVTVAVSGAKVVLEGTVPERRMKHAIEDLADACPGVLDIENRIRVSR